jgi:hypothetical protein
MKLIIKIVSVILITTIFVFGFYLYKLHALAVESNNLFEQRCLKVNPELISYKNSFLKFADYFNHPDRYSQDEVLKFYDGYMSGMRSYIKEETQWLNIQKTFISRWDFKLIEPGYIKQGGDYQWKMYEGYRDDAQFQVDIVDKKINTEQIKSNTSEPRARRDKYIGLYNNFFMKASAIKDWRKIFASVPLPKGCTKKNTIIPDTSGSINWDGKPTPTPFHSDPEKTS